MQANQMQWSSPAVSGLCPLGVLYHGLYHLWSCYSHQVGKLVQSVVPLWLLGTTKGQVLSEKRFARDLTGPNPDRMHTPWR